MPDRHASERFQTDPYDKTYGKHLYTIVLNPRKFLPISSTGKQEGTDGALEVLNVFSYEFSA